MTEELDNDLELEEGLDNEPADNDIDETDYDSEAEKQGWVPKEKYKGDPKRWVDSKTFVERGEIFRPMLHTKYKELETKWEESQRQLAETNAAIERNNKIAEKFQERARQEALEQLKRDQRTAFEQGDDARYNELDKRRDNIAKEFEVEPAKAKTDTANQPDQYVIKFQQENPWFGKDFTLTQAAQFHDARLARENPYISPEARHAEVKRALVTEFPDKFENPNRQQKSGLGSGRNPGKQPAKKGWDSIPEVDRKFAAGFIKGGMSKEDYAKDYWELSKEKGDE